MRHKHYDLILAWACGAEIEYFDYYGKCWYGAKLPAWHDDFEYRIKPEPKPDIVLYAYSENCKNDGYAFMSSAWSDINSAFGIKANIKLTYDGETKDIKYVEKI